METKLDFADIFEVIFATWQGRLASLLIIIGIWFFASGSSGKFNLYFFQSPIPARPKSKRKRIQVGGLFVIFTGIVLLSSQTFIGTNQNETPDSESSLLWLGTWRISPSEIVNFSDGCIVLFEEEKSTIKGTIYSSKEKKLGYFAKVKFSNFSKEKIYGTISLLNGNRYNFEAEVKDAKTWKCSFSPKENDANIKSFTAWRE